MNHSEHGLLQQSWARQSTLQPIPILLPEPWTIMLCGCQLAQILYLSVPVSGLLVSSQGQIPKAVQCRAHPWPRRKLLSFCKRAEHELSILDNHSWTCACVIAPSLQMGSLAQTSQYLRLPGTGSSHRDHQAIPDINHNLLPTYQLFTANGVMGCLNHSPEFVYCNIEIYCRDETAPPNPSGLSRSSSGTSYLKENAIF